MITPDQVHAFAPACGAATVAPALERAAAEAQLTTPLRLRHALAQWSTESGGFTRVVENLNYSAEALLRLWPSHFTPAQAAQYGRTTGHMADQEMIANLAYGGRMGNDAPGDGWLYRGRGWTQLTGRANYAAAGKALGRELVGDPDYACDVLTSARICAWYWTSRNLNSAADRDDLEAVTRGVNGGLTGLDDRRAALKRAEAIWPG